MLADTEFPEARWNVGGVFLYDNAREQLCDFVRQNFARENTVAETHGAPSCAWTLDWFQSRGLVSPGKMAGTLKAVAARNAAFTLNFDNPHIDEKSLGDAIGNTLLAYAAQMPHASVAVASEPLATHIRAKFPSLPIRAGANKVVAENGRGNADYYKDASARFAVVALHSDDAFDLPLLENLAKNVGTEKFEITVNDTCLRDCSLRAEHLATLAEIRKNPWDAEPLRARHALLAKMKCEDVFVPGAENAPRAALFSREDLRAVYALGFRRFRIQAETLRSEAAFFWNAYHWIFSTKPENWHYNGLVASALVTKIKTPVPVFPSGLDPLVKRRYD